MLLLARGTRAPAAIGSLACQASTSLAIAVAGRVVGGGVRAHPVGVRLDQRRALAVAGVVERRAGHRVGGEHVVAVDPDAGEAEAGGALVERDAGLPLERLGDRVLVVLAEEDDRGVEDAGPDERLVDVALAGRAVAEVGDDRLAVVGADLAVHGDAHGVAGRVQRLRADDDRVDVELELVRVPAALVDAAEQAERHDRVDAAAVEDAVLAVGRERHVLRPQRAAGADLRGLLAQQAGPDAQLALALQRGGLGVELADGDQVAVEPAVLVVGEVDAVDRAVGAGHRLDPLTVGGEQLDKLPVRGRASLGHPCLPVCGAVPGVSRPRSLLPAGIADRPYLTAPGPGGAAARMGADIAFRARRRDVLGVTATLPSCPSSHCLGRSHSLADTLHDRPRLVHAW